MCQKFKHLFALKKGKNSITLYRETHLNNCSVTRMLKEALPNTLAFRIIVQVGIKVQVGMKVQIGKISKIDKSAE